ncbi:hypothetical protein [Nocardia sp. IFM 10818]
MTVDKAAATILSMAWALAIRSAHTIVYLPLRHNDAEPLSNSRRTTCAASSRNARHMHEQPETHCCAEISVSGHPQWLHVEYCRQHRTANPANL